MNSGVGGNVDGFGFLRVRELDAVGDGRVPTTYHTVS